MFRPIQGPSSGFTIHAKSLIQSMEMGGRI